MSKRIGLLGPYSSRNLGDTAIQRLVIEHFSARNSRGDLVGICPEPDDVRRTHGIAGYPLEPCAGAAWFSRLVACLRIFAFVGSLDALIISGGGQFDEYWGGAWGHPFWLWAWSWCARMRGVPVAVLGVGMDRLDTRLSRAFVLGALECTCFRAFRDTQTLDRLRAFGFKRPSEVCPDLAFALDCDRLMSPASPGAPYAIVSPISALTWTHAAAPDDAAYFAAFASASLSLMDQGLHVRFVCTQNTMDVSAVHRVIAMIDPRYAGRWEIRYADGVDNFLQQARVARVVLASRLHGAILTLVAGTPVVVVAPLPKVAQLMRDLDLAHLCLDLQAVETGEVIARLNRALQDEFALRVHICARTAQLRESLAGTYQRMEQALGV